MTHWLLFAVALGFQGVLFWLLNRGLWPYGAADCGCRKGAIRPGCPRHDPQGRKA